MNDIEQKIKYQDIINRLTKINQRIQNLDKSISILETLINKSIFINDKCFKEEKIIEIKNIIKYCNLSITTNVVPSMNKKIYE